MLQLTSTHQYGTTTIGVFRCRQGHGDPTSKPVPGLAAAYPKDQGIRQHSSVIFATDFESEQWNTEWAYAGVKEKIDTVETDATRKFQPYNGKALRVKISKAF